MAYSKQSTNYFEPYSQYFIEKHYLTTNECQTPIASVKPHHHKRKISQVSTLSYKSKIRNLSQNQNKTYSVKRKKTMIKSKQENKKEKGLESTERSSVQKKQFSLQKIRIPKKNNIQFSGRKQNVLSNRKQKLRIDTSRKTKPKTTQILTTRNQKYQQAITLHDSSVKSHKISQNSFATKNQYDHQKTQLCLKKTQGQSKSNMKFKIKEHKLEIIMSRCSKVMTEYYDRITQLKKENQFLRIQNQELKKQKASKKQTPLK